MSTDGGAVASSGLLPEAVRRRAGITLVVLETLPTLAIAALVPVLPELFKRFGAVPHGELLVPMILTIPALCVALFASLLGMVTDRFGRRVVLLPSLGAFALFGLGPMLIDGLPGILATRFVVGIAEAGILTVGNALLGDYFGVEERRRWLARQTIVGPIATFVYVAFGGWLGSLSWRGPFLAYLMGLVVLAAGIWTLPEPPLRAAVGRRSSAATEPFPWPAAVAVCATTLLVSTIFFVQNVQQGRIFGDLGADNPTLISWLVNAAGVGSLIGGIVYRYLRMPVRSYLALIFLVYGIGDIGLALVSNYIQGIPFDALGAFGSGLSIPVMIDWALSKYPEAHRGRGMGLWAAAFFIGEFCSPPLVALVGHGHWTFLQSVGVIGLFCLAAAAMTAWPARRTAAAVTR